MNSPIEPAHTPDSAAAVRSRPWIGRPVGSTNTTKQARAVRTREMILADAARQFDTDGYGNTSVSAFLAANNIAKGALYYHFSSKEEVAQQLIGDWNLAVAESINDTVAAAEQGGTVFDRLTTIFTSLAHKIAGETNLRVGMKLTLEPAVDNGAAFARWVDAISNIVDTAITAGDIPDIPAAHRLAWNLCAGTIGATHASATLREGIDLQTRIEDAVTGQLRSIVA